MSVAYLQEVLDTVFDPPAPKDVDIDVPEDSAGMIALKRGKAMFEIMGIRTTDQWGMKAKFVKQGDNYSMSFPQELIRALQPALEAELVGALYLGAIAISPECAAQGKKWLRIGAEKGDAKCMDLLGRWAEKQITYVSPSAELIEEAAYWFSLAYKNGSTRGCRDLAYLAMGRKTDRWQRTPALFIQGAKCLAGKKFLQVIRWIERSVRGAPLKPQKITAVKDALVRWDERLVGTPRTADPSPAKDGSYPLDYPDSDVGGNDAMADYYYAEMLNDDFHPVGKWCGKDPSKVRLEYLRRSARSGNKIALLGIAREVSDPFCLGAIKDDDWAHEIFTLVERRSYLSYPDRVQLGRIGQSAMDLRDNHTDDEKTINLLNEGVSKLFKDTDGCNILHWAGAEKGKKICMAMYDSRHFDHLVSEKDSDGDLPGSECSLSRSILSCTRQTRARALAFCFETGPQEHGTLGCIGEDAIKLIASYVRETKRYTIPVDTSRFEATLQVKWRPRSKRPAREQREKDRKRMRTDVE